MTLNSTQNSAYGYTRISFKLVTNSEQLLYWIVPLTKQFGMRP
jgi:hypothetical protein